MAPMTPMMFLRFVVLLAAVFIAPFFILGFAAGVVGQAYPGVPPYLPLIWLIAAIGLTAWLHSRIPFLRDKN
jgi:hypothetical protein